jgi:hypothetical protein
MKMRIKALADADPLRVPLPNGTEVTTRVDRSLDGRIIKQGAIGRVKESGSIRIVVQVVGVGLVTYAREELTPRKRGQLEYAIRRAASWQALMPNVVLETVVGSRAWGLADEGSDTDKRGVFVLPFPWTSGLVDAPTDLVSADGSANYWEVGKAFRQAIRADPNTLETLLLPGASASDKMGEWTLQAREAFVSVEIYGTFGRYALSQLKRLRQGIRLAEHRGLLLQWLAEDATLSLDEAATKLAQSARIEGGSQSDQMLRAKEYIKQLYSSLFDQGLLGGRNFDGLIHFAGTKQHDFDLPSELRPKNAYNLLRLLATATAWLRTGTPEFVMQGALNAELLAIKKQEVPLADIIDRAEELATDLEDARKATRLPAHPDVAKVDALLRRIREESAKRWHEGGPGPFGKGAATMPLAEWDG